MTRELLEARRADLERKLGEQRDLQARLNGEIGRLQRRAERARDEENAIGGAIQDVKYWEAQLAEAARQMSGPAPEPEEVIKQ